MDCASIIAFVAMCSWEEQKLINESANLLFSVLEDVCYEFILSQFLTLFVRQQVVIFSPEIILCSFFYKNYEGGIFIPYPRRKVMII